MKSGHRHIIYIIILLIFVFGLGLLLWRNEVFSVLNENSGLYDPGLLLSQSVSVPKDSIDTSIFDNAKFIVLKNNVYKFNFDNICRDSSQKNQSASSSTTFSGPAVCFVGNSMPFPVPAPKKVPASDRIPVIN